MNFVSTTAVFFVIPPRTFAESFTRRSPGGKDRSARRSKMIAGLTGGFDKVEVKS
jgi:hypothetical protein